MVYCALSCANCLDAVCCGKGYGMFECGEKQAVSRICCKKTRKKMKKSINHQKKKIMKINQKILRKKKMLLKFI